MRGYYKVYRRIPGYCDECDCLHATTLVDDLHSEHISLGTDSPKLTKLYRSIKNYLNSLPDAGKYNRN